MAPLEAPRPRSDAPVFPLTDPTMAHPPSLAPSPAAARMRRLRERRARGARVVLVEIDPDLLETIEQLGLVGPDEVDDPGALSFALLVGRALARLPFQRTRP